MVRRREEEELGSEKRVCGLNGGGEERGQRPQ
jgi:hypothetical protein